MSLSATVAFLVLAMTAFFAALAASVAGVLHRLEGATLSAAVSTAVSVFIAVFAASAAALTLLTSWVRP